MIHIPFALVLAMSSVPAQSPPPCPDSKSCRQLALEAAERKDYDAFHDLAWRAMSTGPKNDPAMMILLARAQSLSGRPHDALVMLQRLVDMKADIAEAATSEDFANVRALPGWADIEARLAGAPLPAPTVNTAETKDTTVKETPPAKEPAATKEPPVTKTPPPTKEPPANKERPATKETPPTKAALLAKSKAATGKPGPENEAAKEPAKEPEKEAVKEPAKDAAPVRLSFTLGDLSPVGLAYDAVSSRFIVGDGHDRRLLVVGERSGRLASLAGIDAGFHEITAFEIDTKEGDLWVVSAGGQGGSSTVHKLQLISGRVLSSVALPDEMVPGRFADVAVTPQSVLVLDSGGRRVLRLAKKGKTLDVAARLAVPGATALAPASDVLAYAAFDRGILRVDLTARTIMVVEPGERIDLSGVLWMRWFRSSLVAIQRTQEGAYRLQRFRLEDNGRAIRTAEVIDDNVLLAGPTSATFSGQELYYLGRSSGEGDVVIRKVTLK